MDAKSGTARLDHRGLLVLPAALRKQLRMRAGDEARISEESDGVLRVESKRAAAQRLRGIAGTSDTSAVEELRRMRDEDARSEDRDAGRGQE